MDIVSVATAFLRPLVRLADFVFRFPPSIVFSTHAQCPAGAGSSDWLVFPERYAPHATLDGASYDHELANNPYAMRLSMSRFIIYSENVSLLEDQRFLVRQIYHRLVGFEPLGIDESFVVVVHWAPAADPGPGWQSDCQLDLTDRTPRTTPLLETIVDFSKTHGARFLNVGGFHGICVRSLAPHPGKYRQTIRYSLVSRGRTIPASPKASFDIITLDSWSRVTSLYYGVYPEGYTKYLPGDETFEQMANFYGEGMARLSDTTSATTLR